MSTFLPWPQYNYNAKAKAPYCAKIWVTDFIHFPISPLTPGLPLRIPTECLFSILNKIYKYLLSVIDAVTIQLVWPMKWKSAAKEVVSSMVDETDNILQALLFDQPEQILPFLYPFIFEILFTILKVSRHSLLSCQHDIKKFCYKIRNNNFKKLQIIYS